jgi:hypothetical protein
MAERIRALLKGKGRSGAAAGGGPSGQGRAAGDACEANEGGPPLVDWSSSESDRLVGGGRRVGGLADAVVSDDDADEGEVAAAAAVLTKRPRSDGEDPDTARQEAGERPRRR